MKLLKEIKSNFVPASIVLLVAVLIISGVYGIYILKRNINYSLGYESMVKKTSQKMVCDMIKPEKYSEVLVNPKACN